MPLHAEQTHIANGVSRDAASYTFDTRDHGTIEKFNFMRSYGQSLTGDRNDARAARFTYARDDNAGYRYGHWGDWIKWIINQTNTRGDVAQW